MPAVPRLSGSYRRYVRVLQQKNALLRHSAGGQERPWAGDVLCWKCYNEELAAQGEAMQKRRREYLRPGSHRWPAPTTELSHGAERMEMRYAAQFAPGGLPHWLKQRQ